MGGVVHAEDLEQKRLSNVCCRTKSHTGIGHVCKVFQSFVGLNRVSLFAQIHLYNKDV